MLENLEAPYNDIPYTPTSEDIVLFAFQIYWINLKKLDEEYAKGYNFNWKCSNVNMFKLRYI